MLVRNLPQARKDTLDADEQRARFRNWRSACLRGVCTHMCACVFITRLFFLPRMFLLWRPLGPL